MTETSRPRFLLSSIVFAQFAATSLWFAANAVLDDPATGWASDGSALAKLTSMVQVGFLVGTLLSAVTLLSDRVAGRALFFASTIAGAAANAALVGAAGRFEMALVLRFLTGLCLAGIYPVGMRLAASWHERGLGAAIGSLVGALVAGTALPHLLRALGTELSWTSVITGVSLVAAVGGAVICRVPDGPYLLRAMRFEWSAVRRVVSVRAFRLSAASYLGHMWEVYAFWGFVPAYLSSRLEGRALSFAAFAAIAAGAMGCELGGRVSRVWGSRRVAWGFLLASGACCLLSPFASWLPLTGFLAFVLFWGFVVAPDSPQLSALCAQTAPRDLVGTALTLSTCLGFALTVVSLKLTGWLVSAWPHAYFLPLAIGPLAGLIALRRLRRSAQLR